MFNTGHYYWLVLDVLFSHRINKITNLIMYKKLITVAFGLLCFTPWINSPTALVFGLVLSSLGLVPESFSTEKLTKKLLAYSIIGLGFGIQIQEAIQVTSDGLGLIVASIVSTLLLGSVIARMMRMETKTSYLISAGTSICGGSAIAAVSPAINANDREIGLALATVFVLNSLALFIFPVIGHALSLDQETFGKWAAIAIHDTSSVIGAASAYGEEALTTATTLKLSRALWIVPVTFISAMLFSNRKHKLSIPYFIIFYCVAIFFSDAIPQLKPVYDLVFSISTKVMVLCLFLIGCSMSIDKIKYAGIKPMLLGFSLWVTISIFSLIWLVR